MKKEDKLKEHLLASLKILYDEPEKKEESSSLPNLDVKPSLPDLEEMPYELVDSILTSAERNFCLVLNQVVNGKYYLFSKVRLADLFRISKGTGKFMSWFGRIKSRHLDFVLCDLKTLKPLIVIELDDGSHASKKAKAADEFKNELFKGVNIPLVRVLTQPKYDPEELVQLLNKAVNDKKLLTKKKNPLN